MTETEFSQVVDSTKAVVLSAVEKNLYTRFYHAIDDVVQEAYFRAFKGLQKKQFEGRSALSTWLYAIARNESLRMNEKLSREERKVEKLQNQPPPAPVEQLAQSRREEILSWIKRLPQQYMSVMKLAISGFSEKEIAATLAISQGTVKSRSHRARGMLRKLMEKEGEHGAQ
ncbi:MAG: RNA polymerase sigma factor [Spirochaetia bacterium]|nr:RNA polymerase sigma factor [Spirochaetia bacterium]